MNFKSLHFRWINLLPLRGSLRWAFVIVTLLTLIQPTTAFAADFRVNTLDDELNGDGDCSLREAITAANSNMTVDRCPAGGFTLDTIRFKVTGTITLTSQLEVTGGGPLLIDGGSVITISGGGSVRVFYVNLGTEVHLRSLTISRGFVEAMGGYGGGIYNAGVLTLTNSALLGNRAPDSGGGIYNTGTLTLTNSALSHNLTDAGEGGGIYNAGTLILTNSTLSTNDAYIGGGIYNNGVLTLRNSTLLGHYAKGGGGIYNDASGTVSITDSTLRYNISNGDGGGIWNYGTLTLTNSTLSMNTSDDWGAGIYNYYGTLDVNNSTLSDNFAGYDGGIFNHGGQVTLSSSIIANDIDGYGANCFGDPIIDAGYNIEDTDTCGLNSANGSLINTDPLLGPLQDNGGPTLTHALLPGSPAIDSGLNRLCPRTDQRGFKRPVDGNGDGTRTCDIGSFELQIR